MAKTKIITTKRKGTIPRTKVRKALRDAAKKHTESLTPPFITFTLSAGTFEYDTNIIISKDLERCANFVNQKFEKTSNLFTSSDFIARGKVFFSGKGHSPILWLPAPPITPSEQATLAHELLHIVFEVTNWAGISLCNHSEEVYTHMLSHLYRQFYSRLNPPTND